MKIVGFVASPRKAGNTAWVVNTILEGARERGAETETWHYGDLDIKPCQGCLGCKTGKKTGCVLADDMRKIFPALESANALVFGSPLYMGQMSGQAKIFVDRLSSQFMPRFSPFYKEQAAKKLIVVFTQGNPDAGMFRAYYEYTKNMFQLLGFAVDLHTVVGTRNGPAHEQEGLCAVMRQVGALLVTEESCPR